MAISDKKKVQTMINAVARQMRAIRAAVAEIANVRTRFQAANPDVTGTPLEGNVTALNNAFNALQNETDKAIWTALIAEEIESHRGEAL